MKLRWPFARKSSVSADAWTAWREFLADRITSKSGQVVTLETALRVSTVFACVRVIADGLAQVPLKLYHEDTRTVAREHPLYPVLHDQANDWQTSYEFRETLAFHALLGRRFVAFKNIVRGQVVELIPFEPNQVQVVRGSDLRLTYNVRMADGKVEPLPQEMVFSVRGPSWNSWEGMDAINLAREAIGLAQAAEAKHARMHANGLTVPGVYSVEGTLDEDQYNELRDFIKRNYSGENEGLPMIIDRSAKWLPTAFNGVDMQHVELREHQVREICRMFRVQPIMVMANDKSEAYASAEQRFIAHVVHCLAPWYARVEQCINAQLLTKEDRRAGVYAKFVEAGLLRGAMKDRGEYLSRALGNGGAPAWMTQDEARSIDELPPLGGDAAKLPPRLGDTKNPPAAGDGGNDPQGPNP